MQGWFHLINLAGSHPTMKNIPKFKSRFDLSNPQQATLPEAEWHRCFSCTTGAHIRKKNPWDQPILENRNKEVKKNSGETEWERQMWEEIYVQEKHQYMASYNQVRRCCTGLLTQSCRTSWRYSTRQWRFENTWDSARTLWYCHLEIKRSFWY